MGDQLYDEDELGNTDIFLQELRTRFKDESQALQAEMEICDLKQKGKLAKEYVQEFRRVASKLRHWSERLLVYFFKESLDWELHASV